MTSPHHMTEEDLRQWAEATEAMTAQVLAADPTIHPITASIMANDLISAERVTKLVAAGLLTPEKGIWQVGSYARWGWAMAMIAAGQLTEEWLMENICHLWSACDPDDTEPNNLRVFQAMFAKRKGILRDGRALPKGKDGYITVYRGVTSDAGVQGFAWTTDPKVAGRFAGGAGVRVQVRGGVVIAGKVRPSHVLAFITNRKESEVIVDPRLIIDIHQVGR